MRKPPQIRITQNDRAEYARLARNTKAKVRRTFKNYGIDLSNDFDVPELENFQTRKQFNEWREKVESFTNRHNQHYQFVKNDFGVVANKVEINQVKRDVKKAQQIAKQKIKEAEKLPFISGGKQQGTVAERLPMFGERNNPTGITVPKNFSFSGFKTRRDFERKLETTHKKANPHYYDKRQAQMKENFIAMLEKSFNSDAEGLIEKIKEIPPDDFYEMYIMFDEFDFNLYYFSNDDDFDGGIDLVTDYMNDINRMEAYVDAYNQGILDMKYKGF